MNDKSDLNRSITNTSEKKINLFFGLVALKNYMYKNKD